MATPMHAHGSNYHILAHKMTKTVDDLAKPDRYFRVIGIWILVGKERPIESSPDHERVHRTLDVTVAVVAACSGRPICLSRT